MTGMSASLSKTDVVRGIALLSVLGLVGMLLHYRHQPGYSQSRLVLFGLSQVPPYSEGPVSYSAEPLSRQ